MNIILPKISEKTIVLPNKRDIARVLVLAAVSRAQITGMYPLGLAYAASFTELANPYVAFAGICAGMIGRGGTAFKYIIAFATYYILLFFKRIEDGKTKQLALGGAVLFSGLVSFLWLSFSPERAVMLVTEAVITAGAFKLFSEKDTDSDTAMFSQMVVLGAVANGLKSVTFGYIDFNLANSAVIFALPCFCYAWEMPSAVLAGAVMGFMLNMETQTAVITMGIFALAAVLSYFLSGMGKLGAAAGCLCGITVGVLYNGGMCGLQVADIFISLGIFAILPEGIHMRIAEMINRHFDFEYTQAEDNREHIAVQLKTVANAVRGLADGVMSPSHTDEKSIVMKEMFDTAASRVCSGCSLEINCWRKDSKKTYKNMYELWETMETDGYCDYTNMPTSLKQVCMRSERLLAEFNHVYELYKQDALHEGEALSGRGIVARQYGEISKIISLLSEEVGEEQETEDATAKYKVTINAEQEPKDGQTVCGDTLVHFEKNNKFYVILCDGMGSGGGALSQSRLTARLFTEFLQAGFDKETAVSMINSSLALKADQESFSTADILEINLETGEGEFLKVGSAQSFLKTKNGIETVSSKALPVGILEDVEVSAEHRSLKSNDVILMMSDGVAEAGNGVLKNDWIKKLLMKNNRNDGETVKQIIAGAKSRTVFSDDMTGVIIRISKRRKENEA